MKQLLQNLALVFLVVMVCGLGETTTAQNADPGNNQLATSVKRISDEPVKIYRSTMKQQVFVEVADYKNAVFEMFNMRGQLLAHVSLDALKTTIEIGNLADGAYLVKIKHAAGETLKKIVKG